VTESTAVRVLVVDDQALMRDGIVSLLSLEQGIAVVGAAANGEEAVRQAGALQPDAAVAARLVATLAPPPTSPPATTESPLAGLTEREREVLRLVSTGATNREIADILVIGQATVKSHISNILGRLGLRDRVQAAMYARDHGLG